MRMNNNEKSIHTSNADNACNGQRLKLYIQVLQITFDVLFITSYIGKLTPTIRSGQCECTSHQLSRLFRCSFGNESVDDFFNAKISCALTRNVEYLLVELHWQRKNRVQYTEHFTVLLKFNEIN